MDVLGSIPIDVDNSKVILMVLINTMIFHPMTLPYV